MATFNFIHHRCFRVGIDIQRGGVNFFLVAELFFPGAAHFKSCHSAVATNQDLQVLVCAIAVPTLLTQTNGMSTDTRLVMRLLVIANHEMSRSGTLWYAMARFS